LAVFWEINAWREKNFDKKIGGHKGVQREAKKEGLSLLGGERITVDQGLARSGKKISELGRVTSAKRCLQP